MAEKKRDRQHTRTIIRRTVSFLLLAFSIFFAITSVLALRDNNRRMVELRAAVFKADQDNGDIEGALKELRTYVYAHMNTNLASGPNAVKPPIQLKYTYERLNAANDAAYKAATAKVLEDAKNTCVAQHPGSAFSQALTACAKAYSDAHPVTQKVIPDDLYKFDFLSPRWSPDKAGWSMLAACLLFVAFSVRVLSSWFIKRERKNS